MSDLVTAIDAVLPQTQCGLCEYTGCKPYANAIANNEATIDKCLPGGERVLKLLGEITTQDPSPYLDAMREKAKPDLIAVVREDECIGCTKCIQACPVDAIIGTGKMMHTIISDACNGCELCIEPCPVDCIDLVELPARSVDEQLTLADQSRQRFTRREQRFAKIELERQQKHNAAKLANADRRQTVESRKIAIEQALQRAKAKRS